MIDWHSHILPKLDDGSQSMAESISLVNMQAKQGVNIVVATPHFYANDESVDAFLERRQKSLELLRAELPQGAPEIVAGAEVRYYQGISHLEDLKKLRIEGSKVLLLEMPFNRWTEYMIRELIELSSMSGIRLMLAHIERYLRFQNKKDLNRLFESGIMMQSNAEFFSSFTTKRRALKLLAEGKIHFVGSDCHNLTSRPPQIGKAFEIIEKKLGKEYLNQMHEYGCYRLGKN